MNRPVTTLLLRTAIFVHFGQFLRQIQPWNVLRKLFLVLQIVSSASTDLQDYTYYFVPAPWLSCKLLRLLQCYPPPEDGAVKGRLVECLETILNKAQEPPKSKKVQHSNAKNAILFEAISLIIHYDRWAFLAQHDNPIIEQCNFFHCN